MMHSVGFVPTGYCGCALRRREIPRLMWDENTLARKSHKLVSRPNLNAWQWMRETCPNAAHAGE
jgi:hypothetical protein